MLGFELDHSQAGPSKARMEQRTTPEAKELIERAARALGISAGEFTVAAACREARATLHQCEVTRVPREAAQAFMRAFEQEEPAPALVDLMRMHAEVTASREKDAC